MARIRDRRLLFVLLLPVVAAAGACDIVTSQLRHEETTEWRKTYQLPADGVLEINNVNGKIDVEPGEGRTVEVIAVEKARGSTPEAAKQALTRITIEDAQSASGIRIDTKYAKADGILGGNSLQVQYLVKVPADAVLDLETVNGAIDLARLRGRIRADTTNGGVNGRDLAGALEASTTNGGLDIEMAQITGDIKLTCTNGGIKLLVPNDAKATIRARISNGGIDATDLPIERSGDDSRRRLDGQLNGGGPTITLDGTNGGIHLGAR